MRKLLALMVLFCAVFAGAQVPTTPNIGLYIPLHNTPLWDNYMNPNFSMLDNFLSGHAILPRINLGQLGITQYVDYTGTTAPALPAAGTCRMYYDLASNQWTGLNSAGELCSSQNAVGSAGQIGYYATTGRKISPDTCTTDGSGHHTCASYTTSGVGTAKIDFPEGASPGNPSAGLQRIFASSADHLFHCLVSSGASCFGTSLSALSGGTAPASQNYVFPSTNTITFPDATVWSSAGAKNVDIGLTVGAGFKFYQSSQTCNSFLFDQGMFAVTDFAGATIFCAGTDTTIGFPEVAFSNGLVISQGDFYEKNGIAFTNCGPLDPGVCAPAGGLHFNNGYDGSGFYLISPALFGTAFEFIGKTTGQDVIRVHRPSDITLTSNFVDYTNVAGNTSVAKIQEDGTVVGSKFGTLSNCAGVGSVASPSLVACGSAAAGHFSCDPTATGATCVVSTTAVTANSEIFVFESDTAATATALGIANCNTSTNVLPASRLLASSVTNTSFTINLGTVTTNPACFSYRIEN